MVRTCISHVRPGMVTAENIFNAQGNLLLAAETTLTSTHIAWFKSLEIGSINIKNLYMRTQLVPSKTLAATKFKTLALVKSLIDSSRGIHEVNFENIRKSEIVVEGIIHNPVVLIHLTDIYNHDYPTFVHSINVCVLAIMLGLKAGHSRRSLKELALGSLLHDLGKVLVPPEILNKQAKLSPDDWKIIQGHGVAGFDILRNYPKHIPLQVAQVALQHHENYDGSGYARGIMGDEIHEYARIAAIADVYDAVSTDRPYRSRLSPNEAHELMIASRKVRFDPNMVNLFLESGAIAAGV